jgi:phosphatidylglycerol:prolipoprotein diacylglycerol transferase
MGGFAGRCKVDKAPRAPDKPNKEVPMSYIPFPDISPEIFSVTLFGAEFALRWYALGYVVGLLGGWRIVVALMKRPGLWPAGRAPAEPGRIEDLLTWVIVGVVLGGRLGFVLFYHPAYFLSNPLEIVKVWQGGMAFHGGFLGVVVAAWLWAGRNGVARLELADALALATPLGIFLVRIANFINAELWGHPTTMPWGVAFPGAGQDCPGIVGICARHPSQLYEAVLEGLLLGLVLFYLAFRRGWLMRPGQIAGLFFAGYGAARFVVEFFRVPDLFEPGSLMAMIGLTKGQTYSLPMVAVGLWLIWRARRVGA